MVNRPWTSKQGPPEGLRKLSPGAVCSHSKEGRRRASQRECVSFRSESLSPLLGGGVVGSATLCELWGPTSSCPPPVHPLLRQRGYLAPGALSGGRSPTVGEPFTGQQHQTESTCFRVNASLLLRVFPSFLSLLLLAPPCPRLYLTAPRHVTPSLHVREKNPNSTAGRGKSFPPCACSRFLEHRSLTLPPLYTQNSARCDSSCKWSRVFVSVTAAHALCPLCNSRAAPARSSSFPDATVAWDADLRTCRILADRRFSVLRWAVSCWKAQALSPSSCFAFPATRSTAGTPGCPVPYEFLLIGACHSCFPS